MYSSRWPGNLPRNWLPLEKNVFDSIWQHLIRLAARPVFTKGTSFPCSSLPGLHSQDYRHCFKHSAPRAARKQLKGTLSATSRAPEDIIFFRPEKAKPDGNIIIFPGASTNSERKQLSRAEGCACCAALSPMSTYYEGKRSWRAGELRQRREQSVSR